MITDAVTRARATLGEGHPELGTALIYRARLLSAQNRTQESLEVFAEARGIFANAYWTGAQQCWRSSQRRGDDPPRSRAVR